jgi:hypothetical protein
VNRSWSTLAFLSLWLVAFTLGAPLAKASPLCTVNSQVAFGYFNGVGVTRTQAIAQLEQIRLLELQFNPRLRDIDKGDYKLFYNTHETLLKDLLEVFEQRMRELEQIQGISLKDRYELATELLNQPGPWWDEIARGVSGASIIIPALLDSVLQRSVATLHLMRSKPPTDTDLASHRRIIGGLVAKGQRMVFLAHSQGNLFVNEAYKYAEGLVGKDSVKVVHVAPASVALAGEHVLARQDLVIRLLSFLGSVPTFNHDLPPTREFLGGDRAGHGLRTSYLNSNFDIRRIINDHLVNAFRSVAAVKPLGQCSLEIEPNSFWVLASDNDQLPGREVQLKVTLKDQLGRTFPAPPNMSIDYNPAYISIDSQRVVTGRARGWTTITVTDRDSGAQGNTNAKVWERSEISLTAASCSIDRARKRTIYEISGSATASVLDSFHHSASNVDYSTVRSVCGPAGWTGRHPRTGYCMRGMREPKEPETTTWQFTGEIPWEYEPSGDLPIRAKTIPFITVWVADVSTSNSSLMCHPNPSGASCPRIEVFDLKC